MKPKKLAKAREETHKARADKNAARRQAREARDRINRLESALRVLHTWAGVPGALDPEQVRRLTGRALGMDGKEER